MTARILVTGSREWDDANRIAAVLAGVRAQEHFADALLVHGGARGVDRTAAAAWEDLGGRVWPVRAVWSQCAPTCPPNHQRRRPGGRYCPTAGHRRNARMVAWGADLCLAFSRNDSDGTADCVRRAQEAGIPVLFFDYDQPIEEGVWL